MVLQPRQLTFPYRYRDPKTVYLNLSALFWGDFISPRDYNTLTYTRDVRKSRIV